MLHVVGKATGADGSTIDVRWGDISDPKEAKRIEVEAAALMDEAFERFFPGELCVSTVATTVEVSDAMQEAFEAGELQI